MINRFHLKTRMLFSICAVAVLAFGVTIGFVSIRSSDTITEFALSGTQATARQHASEVKADLEVAMDVARTLAQIFSNFESLGAEERRSDINKQLEVILEKNPGFLGVWTCWELNALDGMDHYFVNQEGTDATGRFIPYWNRGSGKIAVEPLLDYEKEGPGDYYLIPKKTRMETILDPYHYEVAGKKMLITSVAVPLSNKNGDFVGVVGIDIELTRFQKMTDGIHPYDVGVSAIFSNNGTIVAHPDPSRSGKQMRETESDMAGPYLGQFANAIQKGESFAFSNYSPAMKSDIYIVTAPLTVGHSKTPWGFAIGVPMSRILQDARSITWSTIGIGGVSILIMMIVVFLIARSIANPLDRITRGLSDGAEQVASASNQVSSASQSLAEGASEQASSIEETSASLEEMSSMTKRNAGNAGQADALMKTARQVVDKANSSMNQLIVSMEEISNASEETSKIIRTIDEIAFQTNLLALNAAVEAARAGEAGAGFAVVADEVRNLAMRAADAAKNTSTLIEGTVKKVRDGSELVTRTNEAFQQVATSSAKVAGLVGEIAAASGEQAQGIGQVTVAVTEMDRVTQQNAASAEESASASEELNAQAEQMKSIVNQLARLVTGRNASTVSDQARIKPVMKKDVKIHSMLPAKKQSVPKHIAQNKKGTVSPDQLILPDDDDLKKY
ncbi:MAG: methyl-accepting chemotaxis protein [Desulfatirhabdiaceae bacterium]